MRAVHLPDQLHKKFKKLAKKKGMTMQALMKKYVKEGMKREKEEKE